MEHKKPFVLAHFGRPDSGKSHEIERFANACTERETIFVFNCGRKTDWQGYEEITLSADKKTETLYFEYKGQEYEFTKHFMKKFRGKKVKARRTKKPLAKSLLFIEMTEPGYEGTFFIVDDAIAVIRANLTYAQDTCFYCAKHVDVWFAVIFHDPNQFPVRAWGALTFVKFFVNNVEPPVEKARKIPHFRKVMQAFEKLNNAPLWSYCTLDMNTGEAGYMEYKG